MLIQTVIVPKEENNFRFGQYIEKVWMKLEQKVVVIPACALIPFCRKRWTEDKSQLSIPDYREPIISVNNVRKVVHKFTGLPSGIGLRQENLKGAKSNWVIFLTDVFGKMPKTPLVVGTDFPLCRSRLTGDFSRGHRERAKLAIDLEGFGFSKPY
jgi:hypothetical protein